MNSIKTCITTALLVLFSLYSFAQGNLQFNQVVYQELSFSQSVGVTNPQTQITITVPTGKVWKIESAFAAGKTYQSSSSYGGAYGLYTENLTLAINERIIYNSTQNTPQAIFPIWLPAGSYTLTLGRNGIINPPTFPTTYNGSISAIEFNIIP